MKIGVRMLGSVHQARAYEDFAAFCQGAGLDAVDLMDTNADALAALKSHSLALGSVDGIFPGLLSDDADERAAALTAACERVDAIADAGGSVLFSMPQPPDPSVGRAHAFEVWKQSWPAFVKHAEQRGVRIALEPWPGGAPHFPTLATTPEMIRAMLAAIPSPALGLCYDPSHFVRLRIDYLRVLAEFGDRVVHVHLKDTEIIEDGLYEYGILGPSFRKSPHVCGGGYWRYTIPGDGVVDWTKVVHRLADLKYDGVLSVELEDHYFWATSELQRKGIATAADRIRKIRDGVA